MTKAPFALAMVLLLGLPALASAGSLSWAPAGPYPTKSSCQPISFHEPDAIAVDRLGNIYIGNEDGSDAVQEVTTGARATIRTLLTRNIEGDYYGLSLAVGPEGRLYIAFKERGTIERLDADGTLTVIAGKPGERQLVDGPASKARLKAPNAIAVGEDGTIYVADAQTIRKVNPDGSITTLAGDPHAKNPNRCYEGCPYAVDGRGRHAVFMSPNGIAVDAVGNVYVADGYDEQVEGQAASIGLIRKVTSRGDVSTVAGNLNTTSGDFDDVGAKADFDYVLGIAVDSSNDIYVAEPFKASIRKIDIDQRVSTVITESSPSYLSTGLIEPAGIAAASGDSLFVTDDIALQGLPSLSAKRVYWLHHLARGKLETLCEDKGHAK